MKLLKDLDFSGKRVFVRADLDVPLEQLTVDSRQSAEATRLTSLKPTVEYLLGHGAKQIIIAGHIDRPKGVDPTLSTKNLLETLQKILGTQLTFSPKLEVQPLLQVEPRLVLLENLRFWPGEEKNDLEFAKQLSALADVYVNEAFGSCHRPHASMVSVPKFLPHAAGLHLQKEVEELSKLLINPTRPFVAIVGGAKIETKLPVIENLSKVADFVLVGGELPHEILARQMKFAENVIVATLNMDGKDIDDDSIQQFFQQLEGVETVAWNGPMGLFEEGHDLGTISVAEAIIQSGAYSVVGGGETTQFLATNNLLSQFSFVSSGGGAMLEFLAGRKLPAIIALE